MKSRRNIEITQVVFTKSIGRWPQIRTPMRYILPRMSAAGLLHRLSKKRGMLRQHPDNPVIVFWMPVEEENYRLDFRFESPLAAAMFLALHKASKAAS